MGDVNAGRPPSDADEPPDAAPSMEAVTVDAEDERAVPEALARLVDTARATLRVMEINAIYPPEVAVTAMEQTTGVLHRLGGHIDLYVGDFSTAGGQAMGRPVTCSGRSAWNSAPPAPTSRSTTSHHR
ncbi:hypothetical protein OWR29_26170 [Actinoplanes sp. Pm04-4]|uniref:Uncharacterized protein n=1 Tax=Paractinoplanes pyxinae TaxID=2997416 RepID=A0ABT4B4S6_9ACTN|nr:hypothetical protein [Actinoplanes pyxinae]MCY1141498.1 hypothetical protein [Actinoplanes pyxinae]